MQQPFTIELEQEDDGRWIAEVVDLPGVMAYGNTREEALARVEALTLRATQPKHLNVMQHAMGYFKKVLSSDEKKELLEVFADYREGYVPLIVPITLLNHYVRKYDEPYLRRQYYLNPHPVELKLRNHV